MKTFGTILTTTLLVLPVVRAQIITDGATNTVVNGVNITGDVTVGTNGAFTLLVLSDNAILTNSANGVISRNATARTNEVRLVVPSAGWLMGGSLFVGSNGSMSRLVVSNGAFVNNNNGILGNGASSSNNVALVTGSGSFWSNRLDLTVGAFGRDNQLIVSNGGRVASRLGNLGQQSGSSNNLVVVTGNGSSWTNHSAVSVGIGDRGNRLVIEAGGFVGGDDGQVGAGAFGGNSEVLVTGPGSLWSSRADLAVGLNPANNRLVVSNGAAVVAGGNGRVGVSTPATGNVVLVTGAGSLWSNRFELYVGEGSAGNRMEVNSGGWVASSNTYVGNLGASNFALVTGAGSLWSNRAEMYVGRSSSGNVLIASNGATVFAAGQGFIGSTVNGNSNSVTVTDPGTRWQSSSLFVGDNGAFNSLVVRNGGLVESAFAEIGRNASSGNNVALLTGAGSLWTTPGLLIGDAGSGNRLIVSNSATLLSDVSFIGFFSANNTALVTGSGSVWSNASLLVGRSGSGNQLIVSNAATVFTTGHGFIGFNNNANGNSATATDPGTRWLVSSNLYVGTNGASGRLIVSNAALLANFQGFLGFGASSSNNTALVTGMGSVWSNLSSLRLGESGAGNWLVISNGALVRCAACDLGELASSSNNVAVVTGSGSIWSMPSGLDLGISGGGNRLVISNGGSLISGFGGVGLGAQSGNNEAVVTGAGSYWSSSSQILLGGAGSRNRLVITNNGVVFSQKVTVGDGPVSTNNRLVVAGGTLQVTNATGTGILDVRRGTNVFNAGLMDVDLLVLTNLLGQFEFNGGTLVTRGANITREEFAVGHPGSTPARWDVRAGVSNHFILGYVVVGFVASFNQVLVTNGAFLTNGNDVYIGLSGNSNSAVISGAGSRWAAKDLFRVGDFGSFNNLIISDGGVVASSTGEIGNFSTSSNNLVLVTGTGSLWTNRQELRVGVGGGGNQLVVSNGGTVFTTGTRSIGYISGGNSNTVTVTDAGSRWLGDDTLYVGSDSAFNRLTVANGGVVASGVGTFGKQQTSSNNVALVTGSGSLWSNIDSIYVGYSGAGNQLVVSNSAVVLNGFGFLGIDPSSSSNVALVTGSGSLWSNAYNVFVGYSGAGNRLVVSDGGVVRNDFNGFIGYASSNNLAVVTGSDSVWSNALDMFVGYGGPGNQLVASNGGVVFASNTVYVGYEPTSLRNRLVVDGGTLRVSKAAVTGVLDVRRGTNILNAGLIDVNRLLLTNNLGTFDFNGGLLITRGASISNDRAFLMGNLVTNPAIWAVHAGAGNHGLSVPLYVGVNSPFNQMLITNGATMNSSSFGLVGLNSGSVSNTVLLSGPNSRWSLNYLYVGYGGNHNRLIVNNGGFLGANGAIVGGEDGTTNCEAIITGAGSVFSNSFGEVLQIGSDGSFNRVRVENGGVLFGNVEVGRTAVSLGNLLTVTDPGSRVQVLTDVGEMAVGYDGSASVMIVSNGAAVIGYDGVIGRNASSGNNLAIVTGASSVWSHRNTLDVGRLGPGNTLLLTDGGTVSASNAVNLGLNLTTSSNNLLHVSGGTLRVTNLAGVGVLDVRSGTNRLDAGLIEVDILRTTNAQGRFEFNGGTLSARTSTVNNGQPFRVGNGASPATFALAGNGTHSFANGLNVSANAALTGNGAISGTVTLANGGTLRPGASIGTIVLSNLPALLGTLIMEVSKNGSTHTNDLLQLTGPLTYGGSLVVSNLGPTPLAIGDRFQLFSASSFAGAFSSVTLPPLPATLTWSNKLGADGSLEVAAYVPPPVTLTIQRSNNFVILSWPTNGSDYCLETSSDLSPPVYWQPITSGIVTNGASFVLGLA